MKYVFLIFFLGIYTVQSQNSWKENTDKANNLETEGKWEDALALRKTAIQLAKNESKATKLYLQALENITQSELNLRISTDYQQAYQLMQKGKDELITSKAEPVIIAKVYRRLGMMAHNYFRNMNDAYEYTSKSIEHHQKSKNIDTVVLSKTLHSAGVLSRELGKLEESIGNFHKFIELYKSMKVKDTNALGSTYRDLSMIYSERFLNSPIKQAEYLTQSKRTFETVKDPNLQYLAVVYFELGLVELNNGNHSSAEGFFNKGIQLYRNNKEKTQSFRQGNLGNQMELQYHIYLISLYTNTKDEANILKTLATVEAIKNQNKMSNIEYDQYTVCLNLVGTYFAEEQPDRAIYYFEKALSNTKKHHERDYIAEVTSNLTNAYFYKKEYQKALSLIASIENSPQKSFFIENRILEVKAKSQFALQQTDDALTTLQVLASKISSKPEFNILTDNVQQFEPGFAYKDAMAFVRVSNAISPSTNQLKFIKEKLFWLALKQFEKNIGNLPATNTLKDNYNSIIEGILNTATTRKLTFTENNLLLSAMENIESRFVINKLLLKRSLASNKNVNAYLEKEQFLRSYSTYLKKKYEDSKDENLKQSIFEEEQKLKKLEQEFIDNNPKYASFLQRKYSFNDFNLPQNQIYIKFKAIDDNLYKITVNQEDISYTKIENYKNLKTDIVTYLQNLTDIRSRVESLKHSASKVYQQLFSAHLDSSKKIVVIPDDILYYLPFELLVKNDDYLVKNHTFSYAVGWSYLDKNLIKQSKSNKEDIAFFAPSYDTISEMNSVELRGSPIALKGAQEEVMGISKLINGRMYIGDQALKSRFKSSTKDVSVLHLSMHSFLNDENPELSSLAFATNEKDSELYISELYGYTFNADLAVLSACNTGVGGFKDGGSLISMSHAFTFAGIPSTVSSLWSAPDQSTKHLMLYFYQHLKQGKSKSEALKNAKLDYLNGTQNPDLHHPFYWAGFVMYGNDEPIDFKTNNTQLIVIIGLAAVLIVVLTTLFILKRRKQAQV